MKINNVRCRDLIGTMEFPGTFWEERLCQPLDIYEDHRLAHHAANVAGADGRYRMRSGFLEISTDDGLIGLAGPIGGEVARIIMSQFEDLLLGEDPRAVELLWDKMYRQSVHGRKGSTMLAISAVDCALWDIRGKWANAPVYQLLGGPTRERIPAYASMLGYSVEPELAAQRAREVHDLGYRAQKWFFRASPAEGRAGLARNVALVRAVREAIGEDDELMLDCWLSWDLNYARAIAPLIAPYRPRWIEEPAMADKPDICAAIRRAVPFPVSNGEHEYTRWGFRQLLELGAQDVLQPDIYWAGGITETQKIATLASCYDVELIPHGHSTHTTAHFIAAMPPNLCPMQEYLIKWNTVHQFFLKHKLAPVGGYIEIPQTPGTGLEIDESLVEDEIILD